MGGVQVITREIATVQSDPYQGYYLGLMRPNDDTLAQRGGTGGLKIYDEIERDTHAYGVLSKRKMALVSRPWTVEPGGTKARDKKAAELVRAQLEALGFDQLCLDLQDALLKGYAVAEVMWEQKGAEIWAASVRPRDQRRFHFLAPGTTQIGKDGMPTGNAPSAAVSAQGYELRLLTKDNVLYGDPVPDRKFIVHRFGAKDSNPYGLGLGARLYWPAWFKRKGLQHWLKFLEKFAQPTPMGEYDPAIRDEDKTALLTALKSIHAGTAAIVPTGAKVQLLEAGKTSTDAYSAMLSFLNGEMSKAVLGETLSTEAGKVGSHAATKTHNDVRLELVQADAQLLNACLNGSIVQWIVDLNMPGAAYPKVGRDVSQPVDLTQESATVKTMAEAGWEPDEDWVQARFGEGWTKKEPLVLAPGTPGQPGAPGAPGDGSSVRGDSSKTSDGADGQAADFAEHQRRQLAPLSEDMVPTIVAKAMARGTAPFAQLLAPIREAVTSAHSLGDLRDKLLGLYPELDSAAFSEVMAESIALANLLGQHDVVRDAGGLKPSRRQQRAADFADPTPAPPAPAQPITVNVTVEAPPPGAPAPTSSTTHLVPNRDADGQVISYTVTKD